MTLWVDRRAALPAGRPATHALVVGVSAYDHLPSREQGASADPLRFGLVQLSSAAVGAFRFATWLRDEYHNPAAPLATVRLLLSPSAAERQACDEVEPADRDHVRAAVLDWQDTNRGNREGMSILYVGGHGAMMSYHDSFVLLQDFAKDQRVLDYSLDVGSVHRGMNGPDLPATQFSFVDACRIRPEAFAGYRNLGAGVGLAETWAGADTRAAPIFFSASPDTVAWGRPGATGTLFSLALLECLDGLGVDPRLGDDDTFRVTNASLQRALEERVDELSRAAGHSQQVSGGGHTRTCELHRFARPPEFPYAIQLAPDSARPVARADIWDGDRQIHLVRQAEFADNPASWRLPTGLHSLDVTVPPDHARFRSRTGMALLVEARQAKPKVVNVE